MQILVFGLSQILAVSRAKVPETLPMRKLIYVSNDAFDAILEPRYTKYFYIFDILVIDLDWWWNNCSLAKDFSFLRLMVRPKSDYVDLELRVQRHQQRKDLVQWSFSLSDSILKRISSVLACSVIPLEMKNQKRALTALKRKVRSLALPHFWFQMNQKRYHHIG